MNKSILVMDTPRNCYECKLQARNVVGDRVCIINQESADYCASVPAMCPLQKLPPDKNYEVMK